MSGNKKHYKARDKTVRKMSRDGLVKENLRSGESARAGRREKDSLALPKRAGDSAGFPAAWNRRKNKRRDNKKQQRAADFKKPGSCSARVMETCTAKADDTAFGLRKGELGADGFFDGKKKLQPAEAGKACGNKADRGFQQQAAKPLGGGSEKAQAEQFFYNGNEKTQTAGADETVENVPEQAADTERRVLAHSSRMENIQRCPPRSDGFVSAVAEAGFMQKKRQARSYPKSENQELAYSKKRKQAAAYYEKENGRNAAAGELDEGVQRQNAAAETSGSNAVDMSGNTEREKAGQKGDCRNQKKKLPRRFFEDKDKSRCGAAGKPPEMSGDAEKEKSRQKHEHKGQKKPSRLSFDDEGSRMIRGFGMGIAKRAAYSAAHSAADYAHGGGQEQDCEAVNGTRKAALAGQGVIRYALRPAGRRRMLKRTSCMREARAEKMDAERSRLQHEPKLGTGKKAADECGAGTGQAKKDMAKRWQKQRLKKTYQAVKQEERAAAAAQAFFAKTKYVVMETLGKNKGIAGAAAAFVLLFATVSAGMSGCGAMLQGASSSIIGTTYPSADADIYAVESDYAALEDLLDSQINSMESTHPGYDEYRWQVDEISHNPYQLISFLTVAYGEFTYEQVKDILPVLFSEQYRLTVEEIVETRTGTEIDGTGEETEVEYEYRILCICLTNKGLDAVAVGRLAAGQAEHYAAYNAAMGNRAYLFDAGSIPSGGTGGAGAGSGYDIPPEALSDAGVARMLQEAEKYLGYPYVWGGSSPATSFDCSGFVSWVINNCGNGWSVGRQTAEGLRGCCAYVPPSEAKPGDLIFFQGTYNTPGASHVGIYVGSNTMIHCGNPIQYSNISSQYWQQHFLAFGRMP